jgi:uncharacterized repeat protein (TIGR01451 family)
MGEVNIAIDAGLLELPRVIASKSSVPNTGAQVRVGDAITYSIWATNVAQTAAFLVPITDAIPLGTVYVANSAVPPVVSGPDPLAWAIPEMLPGVPYSVSFTVIVTAAPESGTILNVAFAGNNPVTETNETVHVFVPTAIQLVSLTAWRGSGASGNPIVTVAWSVIDESSTLGYRVLRSATPERAGASVVSNGVIAATGNGGAYAWDDGAAPAIAAYYWIEEIALSGESAGVYGPAMAPALLSPPHRAYLPIVQ